MIESITWNLSYTSFPIVYSFGSHAQTDFEVGILQFRLDSKIFSFKIDENFSRSPDYKYSIFHRIGLSYGSNNEHLMSLKDIIRKFDHHYIDLLKMDVESTVTVRSGNVSNEKQCCSGMSESS